MSSLRTLVFTPGTEKIGSSRVRAWNWKSRLPSLRVTPTRPLPRDVPALLALARGGNWNEQVLVHRELLGFGTGHADRFALRRKSLVYDLDDAIFLATSDRVGARTRPFRAISLASHADIVIAGNDVLADWASSYCNDVRIIPSCVDTSRFSTARTAHRDDVPIILWIGSRSTERYLYPLLGLLRALNQRRNIRCVLVGSPRTSPVDSVFERVAWSEQAELSWIARAHVGIMPLDDSPWSRAKCGYKLIQYSAGGLLAIGTPVGANSGIIKTLGQLSAQSETEWRDHLIWALELSDTERISAANELRVRAHNHYSYEAWLPTFSEALGLQHHP